VTATPPDLVHELRRRGVADVDDSPLARALYSSDASLYRVVPQVVVRPRTTDEVIAVLDASLTLEVPVTMRGAGTSIAGNAVGPGIVVDTVKHLGKVLSVDPEARTAVVQPGTVHANLQRAAAPHGLRFGPDPSTHPRCTIGGMIGNNACGSRALGYGRTSDNVEGLTLAFGTGEVWDGSGSTTVTDRLSALGEHHLAHIRTSFGRFTRQVSGYSLEHLLPERRRLDRFFVGSEGTLGVVLEATVRLVETPAAPLLVVLGYPSMAEAADAVPELLAVGAGRLIACEGLDARIVDLVKARGAAVPELPNGAGWLFVEAAGEEAGSLAARIVAASGALGHRTVTDLGEQAALWRIREDGAGLAARSLRTPAYSGWEDAAVPPERLGAWLRDFDELLRDHDLDGVPYGHFGDGCVHVRIDFPFAPGDARGPKVFRDFLTASAHKLREHGGSLSGEHGDGRARSELLPLMYDEESIALFAAAKAVCDPRNLFNPGNLVDPAPLDADLRPVRPRATVRTALKLVHDGGSFGDAVHRCTGVGKCVAPTTNGVMCPSYLATRNEKDATRGRARVLQEALDGSLVKGLADPAVTEALDLCLACKGCASDCPTGVDMATYKAEALYQKHDVEGVRRPRSHALLGRLPRWADRAAPVAGLANGMLRLGPVARLARATAGIDQRRSIPAFARTTLRKSVGKSAGRSSPADEAPDVWIWADSFTDHFFPVNGHAAIRYLESVGLSARVIPDDACCGLTWITTGQLDQARVIMESTIATLEPYLASGVPVLALEPSCLATLRSDAEELTGARPDVVSLAELVERLDLPVPDLTGVEVVAQPHCHHHAVVGWETDQALLERAGAIVTRVAGCCGLAGNFGMEKGHYEVSVAVAETHLLPAVRANPGAVVLADGMSCKVQLDDLAGVRALHLAELLADRGR
jgi:FAD/FMN-containing dehydrogenase/Fe-S oxidoreductase